MFYIWLTATARNRKLPDNFAFSTQNYPSFEVIHKLNFLFINKYGELFCSLLLRKKFIQIFLPSNEEKVTSNALKVTSNEQKITSIKIKVTSSEKKSNEQRANTNNQRVKSNNQRANTYEQQTKTNKQRTTSKRFHLNAFRIITYINIF